MTAAPATSVVVELGDGSLGILTDRDLRTRVVAAGLRRRRPCPPRCRRPPTRAAPDRLGGEVLLEMLDRGFRHFPVVSATGEILGVIEDIDLVAAQTRSSFYPAPADRAGADRRRADERGARAAPDGDRDARRAASPPRTSSPSTRSSSTRSRGGCSSWRSRGAASPGATFAWLALGSQARREAVPSSDVDSAIVWFGDVAGGRRSARSCTRSAQGRGRAGGVRACAPTSTARRRRTRCSSARSSPGSAPRAAGSPTRPRRRR